MAAPGETMEEEMKIVTVPSNSQIAMEYWLPSLMMVVADIKINRK